MVDTIFIRKSQRGKGYGAAVIKDMVKDVGRTDIGFSLPISQGFLAGMTFLFFTKPETSLLFPLTFKVLHYN